MAGRLWQIGNASPSSKAVRCYYSSFKQGPGGRSSVSGVVATVFGGTGFYGRYIINRLGRMGSQVIVPYRGSEYDLNHLKVMGDLGQLIFRPYNLRDVNAIREAVKYSNVVINLVGRDYETRNFNFHDVHVEGARAVAEACRDTGVQKLVHFSALGASYDSKSRFMQSKAEGERVVKEAFPDAVIVRPAQTYGAEDHYYFYYYARFRGITLGTIPLIDHGKNTFKYPIFVRDVAQATMNILSEPDSIGQTYELLGPQRFQLVELVAYLYHMMYRPFRPVTVPEPLFRFAAWALEQSPFVPYLTRDILTRMFLTEEASGGCPGLADLDVTPTDMDVAVISFMRRFRNWLHELRSVDETRSRQHNV